MTGRPRVLFVDDEKRVLNSMRGLFRREFELFLTTEGANAVKLVTENEIDVVVADQRMPGMTGIEVLGKIRELSPRTVRILLTGYADQDAVEGSINIGEVFRFLSKPCPPKTLRETLKLAIAAARTVPAPTSGAPAPAPDNDEPQQAAERTPATTASAGPAATPSTSTPASAPATPAGDPKPVPEETRALAAAQKPKPQPRRAASSESHWDTVTEVVMSGETCTEIQQAELDAQTVAGINDVGVVIFTVDSGFAETAIRAATPDRSTTLATTLAKVAEAIEHGEAGILVTDFTTNSKLLQKMIGALKQYLPGLVTIVVASGRDTTDMINLINYGQVFRYVVKPIAPEDLRRDINAAAIRHLLLRRNPDLSKRHEVVRPAKPDDASKSLNQFVDRIQDLRTRRVKSGGGSA